MRPHVDNPVALLRRLFSEALSAVDPRRVVPPALPPPPRGRTVLLAVGKGAAAMACAAARNWRGPLSGLVVTRHGHGLPELDRWPQLEVVEAGHPVPDENSVAGAQRALERVRDLEEKDLVLVLVSGGGSALFCLPLSRLGLAGKRRVTGELLRAGAAIDEINAVRIGLSRIKGGRLAEAAAPAAVETLIISDVVGDDPAFIASGPTVPSDVSSDRVEAILARYGIDLPPRVLEELRDRRPPAAAAARPRIIGSSRIALAAAEAAASTAGLDVRLLGEIEGDARAAARSHAARARELLGRGRPTVLLSGGEVTAVLRQPGGTGGPNTEFALALALELDGLAGVYAIACDTDGIDGSGDNAGALVRPDTLARARAAGVDARAALEASDAHRVFKALGDLVVTGPTQTNVSDFRAVLIMPDAPRA